MVRAAHFLWALLLTVGLIVFAGVTLANRDGYRDFPVGCDSFGYLQGAKAIREAAAQARPPRFWIEQPRTTALIGALKRSGIPPSSWSEIVAPHAFHYAEAPDRVVLQYPPGTAMALSLFEPGQSVRLLNRATILGLLGIALVWIGVACARGAWLSLGFISLCFLLGMGIVDWVSDFSFSINVMQLPFTLSLLSACLAAPARRHGRCLALFSGLLLGFCLLVRIQVLLMAPAVALVFVSGIRLAPYFLAGFAGAGLIPLLGYQHYVMGRWFVSTYSVADTAGPSLAPFIENLFFYLGRGDGAAHNWALFNLLLGLLGLGALFKSDRKLRGSWIAAAATFALPLCYFLTHPVRTPYYFAPSVYGAVLLLTVFAYRLETKSEKRELPRAGRLALGVLALLPGFITLSRANEALQHFRQDPPARTSTEHSLEPPSELRDPLAWVWADTISGTLYYFGGNAGHKLPFSTPELREAIFREARGIGGPQFLVVDSPSMKKIAQEMRAQGMRLEPRGHVWGHPYYLVTGN